MMDDATELWQLCEQHPRLAHYQPGPWCAESLFAINPAIHNPQINVLEARAAARLLAGGQGLLAGDPRAVIEATPSNACHFCLLRGIKVAETLEHVLARCPHYHEDRQKAGIVTYWDCRNGGICLHPHCHSMKIIAGFRQFLHHVNTTRRELGSRKQVIEMNANSW